MAECGSCKAPVVWALSPQGKRSPIDEPTDEKGNVMLISPRGFGSTLAITLSGAALMEARGHNLPLHLNHYATCPDREEWRQRADAKRKAADGA